MVEFGSGPVKEHIDNTVFIVPGIIIAVLVEELPPISKAAVNTIVLLIFLSLTGGVIAFFTYKLVSSLRQKQKAKEEKKKQKLQKKEKETQRKQKKK